MSTISSRTPEGSPNTCPLCGARVKIEPSVPAGDAPCPSCGGLLWFAVMENEILLFDAVESSRVRNALKDFLAEHLGVAKDRIQLNDPFLKEIAADSLDAVELVMALEEEFDLNIPDVEAARIQTVAQAFAYMLRRRGL